jgi:predicted xylose isomerase-like sugar epimerase
MHRQLPLPPDRLYRNHPFNGEMNMNLSIASLRALATEAGHALESEVTKFIDFVEGKKAKLDEAKALLEAAGYTVAEAVLAAPVADPVVQPAAPETPVLPAV